MNRIKIDLNIDLDKEVYKDFYDFAVAGVDFGAKIKLDHPEIDISNYSQYIRKYYDNYKEDLENARGKLMDKVIETEGLFFDAAEAIFGEIHANDMSGYMSVFNCNPRFVENKSFQIYYKKDVLDMLEVTYHEVMHFIFFDYFDVNFPNLAGKYDKNTGKLWELSEILNVVILNLPKFRSILQREEKLFYPDLAEKYTTIKNEWDKTNNIAHLVHNFLD